MIEIKIQGDINAREYTTAFGMACRVDFLTPSEIEAYAAAIYNAIQWGKTVR